MLITAMDPVEFKRAENALDEIIIIKKVPVPKDADIVPESADFENFKAKQEKNQILKVYMETTRDKTYKEISLVGAKEDVMRAMKQTEEFVASKIPKPKPPATSKYS